MDRLSHFERENAKAWDEQPQGPHHCVSIAKGLTPSASTHSMAQLPIAVLQQESQLHGMIQPRPLMVKGYALNPDGHNRSSHDRPQLQLISQLEGFNEKKKWARPEGVVSQKLRDNRNAQEAELAEHNTYRSTPPDNTIFKTTAYYFWPYDESDLIQLLGECYSRLNLIRAQCHVYIDWDEGKKSIRLRSVSGDMMVEAIAGIRSAIYHANAEAIAAKPLCLIELPSNSEMRSRVTPIFSQHISVGHQARILKVIFTGERISTAESAAREFIRDKAEIERRFIFASYVKTSIASLIPLRSGMRMRIHFGHLEIKTYQKNFVQGSGIGFEDFCAMMGAARTRFLVEKRIRDPFLVQRVMKASEERPSHFIPDDHSASGLDKAGLLHMLVVMVKTPSDDVVRLEADLDPIQLGHKTVHQIGSSTLYQHEARKVHINANVINLESGLDWLLELTNTDQIPIAPKALKDLLVNCEIVERSSTVDECGLGYPVVLLRQPKEGEIQDVLIKSTVKYRLKDTPWIIEAAAFRRWKGADTTGIPETSCGITFFNKDWDIILGPLKGVTTVRKVSADIRELFPFRSNSSDVDGFSALFTDVTRVRDHLSSLQKKVE